MRPSKTQYSSAHIETMERGTAAAAVVRAAGGVGVGGGGIGLHKSSRPYYYLGLCPSVLPCSWNNFLSGSQKNHPPHSYPSSNYYLKSRRNRFHQSTTTACSASTRVLAPGRCPFRFCTCLKEKGYVIRHNALKGCPISVRAFSSCGPQEASLGKDKILIDCGPDQECVLGGIVALGKFDALHIGHRELAIQASKAGIPFLLSFVGMAEVLGWEHRAPIVANCDRKRVLSSWAPYCGDLIPLEFQVEFSSVRHLTPQQFVEKLSKELRVSGVVAGENYRFGYRASGDASELVRLCKDYGLSAYIVSPVMDKSQRLYNGSCTSNNLSKRGQVSSTRVRHALAMGDMEYVAELLGRKHRLILTVNEGVIFTENRITAPRSCMLNLPPKEGLYDSCTLLAGDMSLGSCRVVLDTRHVHVELDSADTWTCEPFQDCQYISVEFG